MNLMNLYAKPKLETKLMVAAAAAAAKSLQLLLKSKGKYG